MSTFLGGGGTPSGVITMWSGAVVDIPSGWLLCDGTNGTPNLVGKFIRGGATAGATGGSTTTSSNGGHTHGHTISADAHTLTEAQMPSHSHNIKLKSLSGGSGYTVNYFSDRAVAGYMTSENAGGGGSHSHTISGGIDSVAGHTHTITPPYFELCFIIKE